MVCLILFNKGIALPICASDQTETSRNTSHTKWASFQPKTQTLNVFFSLR